MRLTLGCTLMVLGFSLAGCAGNELVSPVPAGNGGAASTSAGTQSGMSSSSGVVAKRTILQRNPFGDVAETDNLLFDGDFEWTSPFSDEYGWYQGNNPTVTDVVVGPDCKSGIKCARLAKSQSIVGIAVAARDADIETSVWVHFDSASTACTSATATVTDKLFGQVPFDQADPDVHLAASDAPDQAGWCKLSAVVPKRRNKPYLSIRNASAGSMLVDDAVMKAAPAANLSLPADPSDGSPPPPPPAWVPTLEDQQNLEETRRYLRERDTPHDGQKTEARKAFEKAHPQGGAP